MACAQLVVYDLGWFQWRAGAPAPEELLPAPQALPPVRAEVVSYAGATATAWWERALPPTLEPGRAVAPGR
jgi:hypothetical protein